ncbi:MAG: LuxR C-terminal-related transcriptional regulator, partial [Acidimicrobiia bacterium]
EQHALAAELAEQAGQTDRAAALLLEMGRAALQRGALDTAEVALARARGLPRVDGERWLEISEALIEVYSWAGKLDPALEVGTLILNALPPSAPRTAEVHLRLARAAVAAERWDTATGHLEQVRAFNDAVLRARTDAVAAEVAIGQRNPTAAEELARSALDAAEIQGLPEVACEALEVLGRCARLSDLERARSLFDQALEVATEHDLPLRRIRALHERGTLDLLNSNDAAGLQSARDLAMAAGAPALTAVLDIQIASAIFAFWRPDEMTPVAERAAETARLLGLRLVRSMALLWQASAHAQKGERRQMEELIGEALRDADMDAAAMAFGLCRAVLALVEDDRASALAHLDAAEDLAGRQDASNPWAFRGLWALLRNVEDVDGNAARARLRSSGATVYWANRAWLRLADAVAVGRTGDISAAEACFADGDEALGTTPWLRHLSRRLVAEAALADGWGEPVAWLRSAAAFFAETGYDRLGTGCRSLLRRAGEPVPRRGRGESTVPPELRALGVTSREVDVLWLVAEQLGNREIGARLYLSSRTVEKHVASLLAKTGVGDRRELATYAARLLPD